MAAKEQEAICNMFDRIAKTYDAVNRVLSLGQDIRWRNIVAKSLPQKTPLAVLDVATGTADLLISMCEKNPQITEAVGVDLASDMLVVGQKKVFKKKLDGLIVLKKADAVKLPFASGSFDVVSIAFGIRNVVNMDQALLEMSRVLKPSGLLLILEFSLPKNIFVRQIYLFYFRFILPLVGGLISQEPQAYRYLNRTVEEFPKSTVFSQIILQNGFSRVALRSLTFGIATIYSARKS